MHWLALLYTTFMVCTGGRGCPHLEGHLWDRPSQDLCHLRGAVTATRACVAELVTTEKRCCSCILQRCTSAEADSALEGFGLLPVSAQSRSPVASTYARPCLCFALFTSRTYEPQDRHVHADDRRRVRGCRVLLTSQPAPPGDRFED